MRILILKDGDDLFVQGEFASVHAAQHSKRLTEDMPEDVHAAALIVAEWAAEQEPILREVVERQRTRDELRADIERLQAQLRVLSGTAA